jgi:beta-glucuronidase
MGEWIGANSFRTSHYPYSEELMDQADEQGIVVIDECPAVAIKGFDANQLSLHLNTISELIQRDKNRPSVVMWSISNEPYSTDAGAEEYFKKVAAHAKGLDSTRPITGAINAPPKTDKMSLSLDVLMVNRYYGWYSDTGYPQVIQQQLISDFDQWHEIHKKPIMISEYGADTMSGLHQDPSCLLSEDYNSEFNN